MLPPQIYMYRKATQLCLPAVLIIISISVLVILSKAVATISPNPLLFRNPHSLLFNYYFFPEAQILYCLPLLLDYSPRQKEASNLGYFFSVTSSIEIQLQHSCTQERDYHEASKALKAQNLNGNSLAGSCIQITLKMSVSLNSVTSTSHFTHPHARPNPAFTYYLYYNYRAE